MDDDQLNDYVVINGLKVPRRRMWAPDAHNEFLNGVMLSLETSLGMMQTPI